MTLPIRKANRLKNYDYNLCGSYFITICVKGKYAILSNISESLGKKNKCGSSGNKKSSGLLGNKNNSGTQETKNNNGTLGTASPTVILTEYGAIVEKKLHAVGTETVNASIDEYVIMPDHVHFILTLTPDTKTAADAPQAQMVPRIIKWLKRTTNKEIGFDIWQRSYYDHVIRSEEEYDNVYQYIQNNPAKWLER